ncbi:MAG: hypothetical protein M3024_04450 [Candidatus Dormibacteraeota bacterium]|nr:hypothetical protein [Candidatus Dormibacteraeota bacterium]
MNLFNRLLWSVIGLALFALGVAVIVTGLGALGSTLAHASPVAGAEAHVNSPTNVELVELAIAGLVALVLGLVLLLAELRTGSPRRMTNLSYQSTPDQPTQAGRTMVRSGGLENGLQRSLQTVPGVYSAQALLGGDPEQINLVIELQVEAHKRLSTLKAEVREAIELFRRTSGRQPSAQVQIRLVTPRRTVS